MDKQGFIDWYFRFDALENKELMLMYQEARECNCDKKGCQGWAMFDKPELLERTRL